MDTDPPAHLRVALVGPCASGKSTLVRALSAAGYDARQPAQEHSYVPDMWQKLTRPDILIYLDIDYEHTIARRPHSGGGPTRLQTQRQRLAHARRRCDFYLDTSDLTPDQVQAHVLAFLEGLKN